MAEFCLECFNKYFSNKKVTEKDVIMDVDLCEGCGEWKPCVIKINRKIKSKYSSIKCFQNISNNSKNTPLFVTCFSLGKQNHEDMLILAKFCNKLQS